MAQGPQAKISPIPQASPRIIYPAQPVQYPSYPTLIPSQGAQNQFFVFGNLIMGKTEDDSYLKMDLKKTKKDVKVLNSAFDDLLQQHQELQEKFDEETEFLTDMVESHTTRLNEMEKGKGIIKKLEALLESEKKQKK